MVCRCCGDIRVQRVNMFCYSPFFLSYWKRYVDLWFSPTTYWLSKEEQGNKDIFKYKPEKNHVYVLDSFQLRYNKLHQICLRIKYIYIFDD